MCGCRDTRNKGACTYTPLAPLDEGAAPLAPRLALLRLREKVGCAGRAPPRGVGDAGKNGGLFSTRDGDGKMERCSIAGWLRRRSAPNDDDSMLLVEESTGVPKPRDGVAVDACSSTRRRRSDGTPVEDNTARARQSKE